MTATRRQFALATAGAALIARPLAALAQDSDGLPPNVFFSPHGQPFRAPERAPYPVVDWFKAADTNGDGKLDRAEFMADAVAFFGKLDLNGDGVLDPYEIQVYEHRVAPEVLGYRVNVTALNPLRLWRAQMGPAPQAEGDHEPQDPPPPKGLDDSGVGAAPFGFFAAPEPVLAADVNLRGSVAKPDFLKLAQRHFTELDEVNQGYLVLAKLPKTKAQITLERMGGRRS